MAQWLWCSLAPQPQNSHVINGPYNQVSPRASTSLRTCVCPVEHDDPSSDSPLYGPGHVDPTAETQVPDRRFFNMQLLPTQKQQWQFYHSVRAENMFLPCRPMIWLFSIHSMWEFHPLYLSREHQWKVLIGFLSLRQLCFNPPRKCFGAYLLK